MDAASDIGTERKRKRGSVTSLGPARETPSERERGRVSRTQAKGQHESAATAGASAGLGHQLGGRPAFPPVTIVIRATQMEDVLS